MNERLVARSVSAAPIRGVARMSSYQKSIGRKRAAALYASGWWLGRSARELAHFQLFTRELTLPFAVFREALEETLGRPVWTHELGFNVDGLIQELLDERDPPAYEEILELIPADKRWIILDVETAP